MSHTPRTRARRPSFIKRRRHSSVPGSRKLRFEPLEDRAMLSVSLALNGAQTIVPGATINVSSDISNSQSEMSLVVNPTNPLNVVGFSHRLESPITMDVYVSFNGGLNFSVSEIDNADDGLGAVGNRFDPSLQFDANGVLYIAYGYRGQASAPLRNTRLVVARSTDGGANFGNYVTVDQQADILTADTTDTDVPGLDKWLITTGFDPVSGNQAVYLAYLAFVTEGSGMSAGIDNHISVIGSNNGGTNWTPRMVINDDSALANFDGASYASPIVDSLGRLAVSWMDSGDDSVMIDRDTDGLWGGGALFGNDITVRTGIDIDRSTVLPPSQPTRGINPAPMLEVWRGVNRLYLPVVEKYQGSNTDLDIWVGVSNDFGDTWSFNRIDDSAGTEFNPWLQVDPTTGMVNVLYYTTDGDVGTGNDDVRPRLAMSNDGGATWTRSFLSTQQSNESVGTAENGNYGGDYLEYIGLGVRDGTAHGLWASRYPSINAPLDLDAFTANAAFASNIGDNRLFIGGRGGEDDSFLVQQSPLNPAFLEVFVDGVREFTGLSATLDHIIFNPGGGLNTFNIGSLTGISSVTINGTNNIDTYDIVSLGFNAPLSIVLGGGADTVTLGSSPFASQLILSPVTVFGDNGNDTLILGSNNGDSIDVNVTFHGGASDGGVGDRIIFNDTAPSYNVSYDIATTFVMRDGISLPHTVSYSSTEGIVINAGSGADTVTIRSGVTAVVTANGNGGNDSFVVGGGNIGAANYVATLVGGLGNDTLVLDDSLYAGAADWAITDVNIQRNVPGLAQLFSYVGFEGIGIKTGTAGGGTNDITTFGAIPVAVTVTGGAGIDNFFLNNFANEAAGGPFGPEQLQSSFDGGGGFNSLIVDDAARGILTYNMYPTRLEINEVLADDGEFSFFGISAMSVTASGSLTTLNVYGTPASIVPGNQTTVFLGGGSDVVNVFPHDALGNRTVTTNIGIVGEAGTDTLTVQDASSADATNYLFSNPFGAGTQNIFGLGPGGLGTATLENLIVNAGTGADTFDVNQYASGTSLTLNAGGGDDTLNFGNGSLPANITSISAFTFNGQGDFDRFNLHNTIDIGNWTYTRNAGSIQAIRAGYGGVFLGESGAEELTVNAGPGGDSFLASGVGSGTHSIFYGAGGNDSLQAGTVGGLTSAVLGLITFDAGTPSLLHGGTVNVSAAASNSAKTVHITDSTLGAHPDDNLFGVGGSLEFFNITNFNLTLGTGPDTVYAQPLADATVQLVGNSPTTVPGDTLNLDLAGAVNYVITPTSATDGNVTSNNLKTLTYSGFETGPNIDDVPDVPVFIVDTLADELDGDYSAGNLSLREAIRFANFTSEIDAIAFSAALSGGTIMLTLGELRITRSVPIVGLGAQLLTIDASGSVGSRVLNIDDGNIFVNMDVLISGLTITGGNVAGSGGGIHNREDLTITSSTIAGNAATVMGGGLNTLGGNLTVASSTISGNAAGTSGGGIYSQSRTLTVTNSTISGNSAKLNGAGLSTPYGGVLLEHSTITGNVADADGNNSGVGGGIAFFDNPYYSSVNVELDHVVLAGNMRGASTRSDVFGLIINGTRFTLIGDRTGVSNIIDNGGNLIGTSSSPIDPLLGPLAENGGPTMTHALLAGSPAIDAGDAAVPFSASEFDQRGTPSLRVFDGNNDSTPRIDMGAFELQTPPPALPGDYNRDETVDAADYVFWRKFVGTIGVPAYTAADGNGDNMIDQEDRGVWAYHFGETLPNGAGGGLELAEGVAGAPAFPESIVVSIEPAASEARSGPRADAEFRVELPRIDRRAARWLTPLAESTRAAGHDAALALLMTRPADRERERDQIDTVPGVEVEARRKAVGEALETFALQRLVTQPRKLSLFS